MNNQAYSLLPFFPACFKTIISYSLAGFGFSGGGGSPRVAASFLKQTTMKKYIIAIVALLALAGTGCKSDKKIVDPKDYSQYLQGGQPQRLTYINGEIDFWAKRLQKTSDDIASESKLAGLHASRYAYSGDVQDLWRADSLYRKANLLQGRFASGIYRSLAANCITQHRFKQAQQYLDTALDMGDDKVLSLQQQFDVALELGNESFAQTLLARIGRKTETGYLIRSAKYKDHAAGDLNGAIEDMEKALQQIEATGQTPMLCWAMANLADMYSHANRWEDAYRSYLAVLQKDPHYYHALKGIAWLAFSHDGNTAAAINILQYLQQQHPIPDYNLLLAEIAAYQNDPTAAQAYENKFMAEVQQPQYGGMYNKYLFNLLCDGRNAAAALQLAQTEVANRPTAESYYLLSKAYFKNGNNALALQTAQTFVEAKCFEPDVLHYLGTLYQQSGNKAKARQYLREAAESSVELGPLCAAQIKQTLQQLN
jgi:tetratricopeptide (TPR) repeat protein